jgi:outer membrane lipoprotein-sorting protein
LKKVVSLALILFLVVSCTSFTACGGGEQGEMTPAPSGGDETLEGILARAADLPSVKFDQVLTSPVKPTMSWKVWVEEKKTRIEMSAAGQDIVMLIDSDAETAYTYIPAENMAMEMNLSDFEGVATEAVDEILDYNPTVIGTETWDGKVCTVIEYTVVVKGVESKTKQWIWIEHGFPIRTETIAGDKPALLECRNFEFGDIPDSMFELPPGVEIISGLG